MLPRLMMMIAALCVGCTGPTGPAGAAGPPGERGPEGARGEVGPRGADGLSSAVPHPVWVDSAGAFVGADPWLVDDAGVFWPLDVETGAVDAPARLVYWTDAGCTGEPVVDSAGFQPRTAARFDVWRVRGLSVRSEALGAMGHTREDGGCQAFVYPVLLRAVRLGELVSSPAPASGFVGPLHRELR